MAFFDCQSGGTLSGGVSIAKGYTQGGSTVSSTFTATKGKFYYVATAANDAVTRLSVSGSFSEIYSTTSSYWIEKIIVATADGEITVTGYANTSSARIRDSVVELTF